MRIRLYRALAARRGAARRAGAARITPDILPRERDVAAERHSRHVDVQSTSVCHVERRRDAGRSRGRKSMLGFRPDRESHCAPEPRTSNMPRVRDATAGTSASPPRSPRRRQPLPPASRPRAQKWRARVEGF